MAKIHICDICGKKLPVEGQEEIELSFSRPMLSRYTHEVCSYTCAVSAINMHKEAFKLAELEVNTKPFWRR